MENDFILRINQAIDYIYKNLDKNLTVEEIADYCCFSKFYFNRLFKSIVDESIYSFVRRVKLESAAFKMRIQTKKSITDIALEIGYSPSNFASAFKDYFGISASEFRKTHNIPLKNSYMNVVNHINNLKKNENYFHELNSRITIRKMESIVLKYRRFIGNYSTGLLEAWEGFCKDLEGHYIIDESTIFMGISHDDPMITDENRCVYDMCIKVDKISGVDVHKIPSSRYACYEFFDLKEKLMHTYNELFSLWMPFCDYNIDNNMILEIYHSGLDDKGRLHLDICIPLK